MDSARRNVLRAAIVRARRLLEKEFQEQLEGNYNILSDGRVLESAPGDSVVRARLLEVIQHHHAGGATAPEAVDRVVREAALTVLNRFAALKMAERRDLVRECVSQGLQSEGIRELAECAPGLRGALEDGGYRLLLDAVMDEISLDLKVLFDRRDSMAPLWPGPKALDDLLAKLNDPQLADVWSEDETIGWIYQYFNDNDVKEMRDAAKGGAPRNSHELAVRNQFFTPRYVVEFLTDNTLGRLWYEMKRGETALSEHCRYIVRRPTEVFLQLGESVPESAAGNEADTGDNLSQEELLRQPVHIPHRLLKDPREIRLLDPACGSMHFGLYAFDLLTVIYDESWEIAHGPDNIAESAETFAPFVAFAAKFPDKAAFLREVPRLIVERNIHGIDIDPRAAQIAGLSLWLRAERAWHEAGVKPGDRPRITRSNLVCAESMPGEKELLREFTERQFPAGERPAFAFLLEAIFDRMTLAGEAGSLLRIDQEIRTAIADAKRLWKDGPKLEQGALFSEIAENGKQGELRLDLSGITDQQFWERAEQRIYGALEAYAEHAENGGGLQRRLFADDAAHGFAFIDLCRKRYDVVVMNPPFGTATRRTKKWFREEFPTAGENLSVGTIQEAFRRLAEGGTVGLIGDLPWLQQAEYAKFREELLQHRRLRLFAEVGWGILGTDVEVALAVFTEQPNNATMFADLVDVEDQATALRTAFSDGSGSYVRSLQDFACIQNQPFAYQVSEALLGAFKSGRFLRDSLFDAVGGVAASEADRVFRCWWEVPSRTIGRKLPWAFCQNGSPYSPLYYPTYFLVRADGGTFATITSYPNARTPNSDRYWAPGLSYGKRTSEMYSYPLPGEHVFTWEGQALFPRSASKKWQVLGLTNSTLYSKLSNLVAGQHKYAGYLNTICLDANSLPDLGRAAASGYAAVRQIDELNELSHAFSPRSLIDGYLSKGLSEVVDRAERDASTQLLSIDTAVSMAIGDVKIPPRRAPSGGSHFSALNDIGRSESTWSEFVMSFALGCVFGRWDIRYAIGERPAPEPLDAFAPLPVCPPGMLQGDDGLPLSPEAGRQLQVEGRYPLEVAWDGILVDDPEHPLDLERGVRTALGVLWGNRADALEHEACKLLGVSTLGEWFRRPAGFFAEHLKRYSKSRRKAPIYWPLSTASGSYTIWLYYHRITADTLFHLVAEYLEPKLRNTKEERLQLEAEQAKAEGRESAKLAKHAAELVSLERELEEMKAELLLIAELPFKPDLNDGVQINAAPLWKFFRLPKWRKDLEATWKKLEKAECDWAHLAYAIWPERVRAKCKTDGSLAIAHGLEALCEVEAKPKKKRKRKSNA